MRFEGLLGWHERGELSRMKQRCWGLAGCGKTQAWKARRNTNS